MSKLIEAVVSTSQRSMTT